MSGAIAVSGCVLNAICDDEDVVQGKVGRTPITLVRQGIGKRSDRCGEIGITDSILVVVPQLENGRGCRNG